MSGFGMWCLQRKIPTVSHNMAVIRHPIVWQSYKAKYLRFCEYGPAAFYFGKILDTILLKVENFTWELYSICTIFIVRNAGFCKSSYHLAFHNMKLLQSYFWKVKWKRWEKEMPTYFVLFKESILFVAVNSKHSIYLNTWVVHLCNVKILKWTRLLCF